MTVIPLFFFLVFSQVVPFTSTLSPYLGMVVIALFSSIFGAIIGYLMFAVVIPLSGLKVSDRTKSSRMWFLGWIFIAVVLCSYVFFSFVYDTLFPTIDSDVRSLLPPLTITLVLLILISPPLRSKTTHFFARLFGTEEHGKE